MNEKMFKEIVRILRKEDNLTLAKLALKHANDKQKTTLGKTFPEYYHTARTGRVTFKPEPVEDAPAAADLSSKLVEIKGKDCAEQTTVLTGYGHKAAADRECQQFRHPNVFIYQSAIFPDPRSHGVQVEVVKAEPVELENPPTPLYPWGVSLTLRVHGKPEKVYGWLQGFQNRVRQQVAG